MISLRALGREKYYYHVLWNRWPTAPRADGHWYVDDFGAADNGSDSKAAFARLGKAMRAYGKHVPHSVRFTAGKRYWTPEGYHFTGLTRLTIDGQGSQLLACGFTSGVVRNTIMVQYPFKEPPADIETQLSSENDQVDQFGYLINTVGAGSSSITLKTPAEALKFSPGRWAFIYGLDIYRNGGQPPGVRYFEWVLINAVNASTGVITFTSPLVYSYHDSWYDGYPNNSGRYGAPRLIPWEDRGVPIDLVIKNIQVVPFKTGSAFGDDVGSIHVAAKNCTFDNLSGSLLSIAPAMGDLCTIKNCGHYQSEFDKCLNRLVLRDTTVNRILAGTSVLSVDAERLTVTEATRCQNTCLDARYTDCSFPDSAEIYEYAAGNIEITGGSINGSFTSNMKFSDQHSYLQTDTYTVEDTGGVSTALVFPVAFTVYQRLLPGDTVFLKRRSSSGFVPALLTGWRQGAAGEDIFDISCADLVLANSIILYASQPNGMLFSGVTQSGSGGTPKAQGYTYVDWKRRSGLCEVRMSDDLYDTSKRGWVGWRRPVTLNSITINVSTPYTGSDATPKLILASRAVNLSTWDASTLITRDLSIDLRTAGVRTITQAADGTPLGADSLAGWNAYRSGPEVMLGHGFSVSGDLGANKIIGDSANTPNLSVMPQVDITFTFTPVVS